MIAQTATRPIDAPKGAQPPWPVEITIGVAQGDTLLTSGSLWDWPLFDSGTAAWLVVVPKPKTERQQSGPVTGHWDMDTAHSEATTTFQPILVVAEDEAMMRMESAAAAGDERAFLAAKDAVDWETRPADDFLRAVQLALSAGAHMAARNLATQGARRFPDHSKLEKFARILAPPRVLRVPARPNAGIRANRDWLMAHGVQYRGQWVALHEGQLLAVGDSLDSVIAQVGGTDGVLFTKAY